MFLLLEEHGADMALEDENGIYDDCDFVSGQYFTLLFACKNHLIISSLVYFIGIKSRTKSFAVGGYRVYESRRCCA